VIFLDSYARKAIIFIILLFVVFGVGCTLTGASSVLLGVDAFFLLVACLFFVLSVIIWLFSWSYVIKKHTKLSFRKTIAVGAASFYGSLTPIQLGAEALRSLNLKKLYGINYNESISASMVVKGAKFFVIGLFAAVFLFSYILSSPLSIELVLGYASGFFVITLACMLFLLPINRAVGYSIAGFFAELSNLRLPFFSIFAKLSDFFKSYSEYLSRTAASTLFVVFFLCVVSWLFEIAALYFSFAALSIFISMETILVFATLIAVIERNPLLPRGLGLVELVGYYFLAMPSLVSGIALTSSQIIAVIIVYDIVRLVVPTVFSIIISYPLLKMLEIQESRKSS